MTTFAYSIFQMIRRSRPGTQMADGPKIEFREDADAVEIQRCKNSMFFYEQAMRGHSHLLKKPLLELGTDEIGLFEGPTGSLIADFFHQRRLMTEECRSQIESLPAPDARFLRRAFDDMISPKLRKIASAHPECSIYWWQRTSYAQITIQGGRDRASFQTSTDALAILRAEYANLGAFYEASIPLIREIEKEIQGILKDPKSWPPSKQEIAEGEAKTEQLIRGMLNRLTKEEKALLRANQTKMDKVIQDFMRTKI
jgi:hypothetical protein